MSRQLNSRADVEAECKRLGVRFGSHYGEAAAGRTNVAAWARLVGKQLFRETVWMTVRPTIIHPDGVTDPFEDWQIICHELVHWQQQPGNRLGVWWWAIRYGTSKEFRWKMEREAFLEDIRLGRRTVDSVVGELIDWYGIDSVSRSEMIRWFTAGQKQ